MRLYVLSLSVVLACVRMSAANIVQDPGFEVGGDQTCNQNVQCAPIHPAWTFIDAASGSDYGIIGGSTHSHSGTNAAYIGGTTAGSYDVIQQTLMTTPGQFYTLSFWLDTHANHSNTDFQGLWFPSLQAAGTSTVLKFAGTTRRVSITSTIFPWTTGKPLPYPSRLGGF